jgi:hypothetical protein
MASTASPMGVSAFFSASEARIDRWRTLNRIARALAAAGTRPPAGPGEDLRAPAAQRATPRGARVRVHGVGATLATTVRLHRRPDDAE